MEDKAHRIHWLPGWQVLFYFFIAKSSAVGFNPFFLSPWTEAPVHSSKAKKVLIMRGAFLFFTYLRILLFTKIVSYETMD